MNNFSTYFVCQAFRIYYMVLIAVISFTENVNGTGILQSDYKQSIDADFTPFKPAFIEFIPSFHLT